MKLLLTLLIATTLSGLFALNALAQGDNDAAQRADDMRLRLLEVNAREAELEALVHQLEEQLKPESIERSLAGVGSTKPEELRELRRRQLTIEKDTVTNQLNVLVKTRERLEAEVAKADAKAYQQSADTIPVTQAFKADSVKSFRWPIAFASAALAIGLIALIVSFRKFSLR